jgi:multidrug efflux pump subunit AcrA (membrane-fusion protein)
MKKLRLISALLLCLALLSLPACGQSDDKSGVDQHPDKTNHTDRQVTISGRGTIVASNDRNLSFSVDGKIQKLYTNEGDKVSRGDLLAKLDTIALESAFAEAKADLIQTRAYLVEAEATKEQAEYDLEETREPYSEDEIDSAERVVSLAEDYLEYVNWMLDQAEEKEEDAEDYLEYAENYLNNLERLPDDPEDPEATQEKIVEAELRLRQAQAELYQAEASVRQWENEAFARRRGAGRLLPGATDSRL